MRLIYIKTEIMIPVSQIDFLSRSDYGKLYCLPDLGRMINASDKTKYSDLIEMVGSVANKRHPTKVEMLKAWLLTKKMIGWWTPSAGIKKKFRSRNLRIRVNEPSESEVRVIFDGALDKIRNGQKYE